MINLLQDLQRDLGLAYIFIGSDLAVVKHIRDRVAVMYLGRIVEFAPKRALYATPRHPYTRALLSSVPVTDPTLPRREVVLQGDVPGAMAPPEGSPFQTRCPHVQDRCSKYQSELRHLGDGHQAACHFAESLARAQTPVSDTPPPYVRRLAAYRRLATSLAADPGD